MASAVVSAEKSASSMRLLASVRLVVFEVRLLTTDWKRLCAAPSLARAVVIVCSCASTVVSAVFALATVSTVVPVVVSVIAVRLRSVVSPLLAPVWILTVPDVPAEPSNSLTPLKSDFVRIEPICAVSEVTSALRFARSVASL